jgi:2-polyprenyl-3-methyl-5-hydroxy-6-metoxy-1,4-benzoquinol methylase
MNYQPKNEEARDQRIRDVGFDLDAQEREIQTKCNLCDQSVFIQLTRQDRYGFNNPAFGCRACGLVFLNPRMTQKSYGEFYKGTYRRLVSAYHGREISEDTLPEESYIYAQNLALFLSSHLMGHKFNNLLDVGGSIGVIAKQICEEFDLSGTVLDPSPQELEKAAGRGLNTHLGTLSSISDDNSYDVVLMCQTIDHCLDITADLSKIRALLRPGGIFYFDIIDLKAIFRRERSLVAAIKPDHPFYLTEFTAERYLKKTGFELAGMEYSEHRIGFLCKPTDAADELCDDNQEIRKFLDEIRQLQVST